MRPFETSHRLALAALAMVVVAGCGTRLGNAAIIKADTGVGSGPVAAETPTGAVAASGPAGSAGVAASGSPGASTGGSVSTGLASGPLATGSSSTGAAVAGTGSSALASSPAASSAGSPQASSAGCTQEGPPVVIGQVGTFSGLVGANFGGAIQTPYVWVNYANAHGGLGCHPIHFIQMDDQSDPATSEAEVEQLVENDHTVALFAAFTPLDMSGFIAGVQKEGVAVIGGDQSEPDWISNPYLYPVGGTSRPAIAGSVKQAAEIGRKKIAVFYCVEASPCGANFYDTIVKDGFAKKFGMSVVTTGSISITQPDFTAQCQDAKSAGADTIAWGLDRAGLQRAAQSCAEIGYFPTLPLIALQGTFDPTDPNIRKSGAFLSSPTFPYFENSTPAENTFHATMQHYTPSAPLDTSASIVWSDGQMLQQVVTALGASANRALAKADFFVGAGRVKNETLGGLIPSTSYVQTGPQVENPCYFGLAFSPQGTFGAPLGNTPSCI